MTDHPQSKYRWYILALGIVTHVFVASMSRICMPVLFPEISVDLGLNLVQLGIVWGMVGLAGLFTAFISGVICDRFGTKRTLVVTCLLQGLAGASRGLATGFTSLVVFTLLYGLFTVPLTFVTHKAASEWFSEKQLGLANGLLAGGMAFGVALGSMISATLLSPLLGGWRNVMFAYGAVAIVIGFLWFFTRYKPPQVEAAHTIGAMAFRQALLRVVHVKNVWLIGIVTMCLGACLMGLNGYLPLYLQTIGWTEISADGALAALSGAAVIGVVPLALLSDRIGLRKVVIYPAILIIVIGVGLLSVFGGVAVWLLVILVGVVREGMFAIMMTMVMETEGVGPAYSGTALGLRNSFGHLGGFFSPPVGNRLAVINPSFAFIFWSAMAVIGLLGFYFVEETGWKKRKSSS